MKKLLAVASFVAISAALTACGGNDTPQATQPDTPPAATTEATTGNDTGNNDANETNEVLEPVTVNFWHAMTGPHHDGLINMIEAFHAEYPHITINEEFQGNYPALNQSLMGTFVSRTAPLLAQATTSSVTQYIDYDFILSLTNFFNEDFTQAEQNDIVHLDIRATYGNDIYSVPFGISTRILFYNRDILDEFGLEPPTTWDEVRHIAEVTTTDNRLGMGWENAFWSEFVALLEQYGGVFVDEATAVAHFSSPEGEQALGFIYDLIDEGISRTAGEDGFMSGVFGSGAVTMYIGSSAGLPHVEGAVDGSFNWGTAPTPGTGTANATLFAGNDVVMFNESITGASQAEIDAAWAFLRFSLRPDVTAYWAADSGYTPARYSAMELPFYVDFVAQNPTHRAATLQAPYGFYLARVHGMSAVLNQAVLEYFNESITPLGVPSRMSVQDALANAENRANEILADANN
ncbi:MAG: ABC transporter substrate-binding protein [Defluviitaleaceae bacterium]|nr:ABC transporter substrate-binding protein [Defluviitaleaceae bacterium]